MEFFGTMHGSSSAMVELNVVRTVLFPFSTFRSMLSNPPVHLLNTTMGHSDAVLALGIMLGSGNNKSKQEEAQVSFIDINELTEALNRGLELSTKSQEDIAKAGWKVVHSSPLCSLYKKRFQLI